MPGEFDFINWLKSREQSSAIVQTGIGDDLAVLKWPEKDLLLVGVDQVLDGVHFDSTIHSPRQIGRKVMNRNLSDCAAMGCLPAAAIATVALPHNAGLDYSKELYEGLREAADPFDCPIVGGDTASWPGKLTMTVTILGRSGGVKPVLRSGAQVGDLLVVTGPLGGSILGRHMNFSPRVEIGRDIAPEAHSMIDLSDGLASDLRHICEQSKVGAIVEADLVPIHEDAMILFRQDRISPLDHALYDGEDYELLFSSKSIVLLPVFAMIGRIVQEPGVWLHHRDGSRVPLRPRGWEHSL